MLWKSHTNLLCIVVKCVCYLTSFLELAVNHCECNYNHLLSLRCPRSCTPRKQAPHTGAPFKIRQLDTVSQAEHPSFFILCKVFHFHRQTLTSSTPPPPCSLHPFQHTTFQPWSPQLSPTLQHSQCSGLPLLQGETGRYRGNSKRILCSRPDRGSDLPRRRRLRTYRLQRQK